MTNLVGQCLGRYRIVDLLGEGGMAKVYKAYDDRLERYVAIKVILSTFFGSEELFARFEREAKALAQLSHPNIVNIHDYGEQGGMPYLVMEYVSGGTLQQKMGKAMHYREAAQLLEPIARALAYAHKHKFIHRDIKPANILMTEFGQPMLSDFGIAKKLVGESNPTMSNSGLGLGTPEYMAPEQGLGKKIDHRADIYSLGIVFYELVTGRKPFYGKSAMEIVLKHVREPIPNPTQYIQFLPDSVGKVIAKATAKHLEDRFQMMESFANALEKLIHGKEITPADLEEGVEVSPKPRTAKIGTRPAVSSISKIPTQPDTLSCPFCNEPIKASDKFCPACGKPVPEELKVMKTPVAVPFIEPTPKEEPVAESEWKLVVVSGQLAGQSYVLGNEMKIGRSRENDIQLKDLNASRRHAMIQRVGNDYRLTDLNSSNGTAVNGVKISKPTPLKPGDKITIGDTLFLVEGSTGGGKKDELADTIHRR